MQTVKLEVPMDSEVLKATAEYFTTLSQIEMLIDNAPKSTEIFGTLGHKTPVAEILDCGGVGETKETPGSEIFHNPNEVPVSEIFDAPEVPTAPEAAKVISVVPTAPLPSETDGVIELDSEGLPWDARIHSSGAGKLAKTGCWKRKRNIDPITIANVEAELRQKYDSPAPAAPLVNHPALPPTPSTTHVPPAPAAPEAITQLPQLMKYITGNEIQLDVIMPILANHGLKGMPELAMKPELIPVIAKELGA